MLWAVDLYACGVKVSWWYDDGLSEGEPVVLRTETNPILQPGNRWTMASKWIAEARKRLLGGRRPELKIDPAVGGGRPALSAFLTEVEAGEGLTRERSVLMLAWDDGGMRIGLKDEAMGGWLWRACETLVEGLDALEAALADGSARFGSAHASGQRRRPKRG